MKNLAPKQRGKRKYLYFYATSINSGQTITTKCKKRPIGRFYNRKYRQQNQYCYFFITTYGKIYELSSLFTFSEIAFPSALPASSFEAMPITLPISFIDSAPVFSIMAFTQASNSSSDICSGR